MTVRPDLVSVRELLEGDRIWCAYALADLDPELVDDTTWFSSESAVVLIYHGLTPPVLFAHGDPRQVAHLFQSVPGGTYTFTLMPTHRALLGRRLSPRKVAKMWRMSFRQADLSAVSTQGVVQLKTTDLSDILGLLGRHPDRPDSFSAQQLETGVFFGVREGTELVAIAGTYVTSKLLEVAAVGNVFTRPDYRCQGLARRTTASVLRRLQALQIRTIVLNVGMTNEAAVHLYRQLGFWPYCGYYEGVGELATR